MKDAANKSMDVRAKQRLCYQRLSLNSELRGGGFAHVNSGVVFFSDAEIEISDDGTF